MRKREKIGYIIGIALVTAVFTVSILVKMKNNPVKTISDLCRNLPEKDIFYADAFILRRDFTSLRDLVSSTMKKVEKNYTKENPKEDLLKVDYDKLKNLLNEIDNYLILLGEDMNDFKEDDDIYEEVEYNENDWY